MNEQKCASHTLATNTFISTAFVPRHVWRCATAAHLCTQCFYAIGRNFLFHKNSVFDTSAPLPLNL